MSTTHILSPLPASPKSVESKGIKKHIKLDNWLRKKKIINDIVSLDQNKSFQEEDTRLKSDNKLFVNDLTSPIRIKEPKNVVKPKKSRKRKPQNENPENQSTLNDFLTIKQNQGTKRKTLNKTPSIESSDLPSPKLSKSKRSVNKLYKKYGIILPSLDEILKEKRELEDYKNRLESFQCKNELSLELPLQVKDSNVCSKHEAVILDCKNLSFKKISKAIRKHLGYLEDIMCEKVYNARHLRFYNKNKKIFTLTTKDLTYNTSMILFTYDQNEYMLTKLKKYLDPEDKLTQYFFQVLLPELCLRIFMDSYKMSREEAVACLDSQPLPD